MNFENPPDEDRDWRWTTILPEIINKQMDKESVILEAARSPDFNINKLLAAMNNAEEIH